MAITTSERVGSRASQLGLTNRAQIELVSICSGADVNNEAGVKSSMVSFLTANFPTGYLSYFENDLTVSTDDGIVYSGLMTYISLQDDMLFTFDTTGGTAHITQSIETINSYPASGFTAPDFKGAIGVTKDNVEGVDIVSRVYRWTETYYKTASFVDDTFKNTVFNLTGKTNDASFRSRSTGEVLFEGCRGARRGYGPWELTFAFQASPNATGLAVGDITGVNKKGWEYLWIRYQDIADTTAQMIVKRPICVKIEKVYFAGDFSGLGI